MFKQRLITAAILVPLIAAAVLWLSTAWLAVLTAGFCLIGAWEWTALCGLTRRSQRAGYVLALAALGLVALYLLPAGLLLGAALLWWLWALVDLLRHEAEPGRGLWPSRGGLLIGGLMILIPTWLALVWLHASSSHGPALLLYVLVLVWVADSAAYGAGRAFGRVKLAPHVSPGKTVEGVAGGMLGVLLVAAAAGVWGWHFTGTELAAWLAVSLATGLISVLGDLVESRAKRVAGVKDSGTLFPGHGGVLDRIDALTAAVPLFTLAWLLRQPGIA